jgi:hypothetical protein
MLKPKFALVGRTIMALTSFCLVGARAKAAPVLEYWVGPVQTHSFQTCQEFAREAMRGMNMRITTSAEAPNIGISGIYGGTSAVITCIVSDGKLRAAAVTVVAGDNYGEVLQVLTSLRERLAKAREICYDTCDQ